MGSTIAEAKKKVNEKVYLKTAIKWNGKVILKTSSVHKTTCTGCTYQPFAYILLLFTMFGNFKDAVLVFLNVPFAIVGGIAALLITGTNFSISAGIGFIALFGICIQDGSTTYNGF